MRTSAHVLVGLGLVMMALQSAGAKRAPLIPGEAPGGSDPAVPTYTLLYEAENPRLTLIVIPGGEGRIGFGPSTTDTQHRTALMVKKLVQKDFSAISANVVMVDSPVELLTLAARAEREHLDRIESVVRYYRDKWAVPTWLMGHSNGTVSVTRYLALRQAATPVAGAVLSGSRYEIQFGKDLNV